MTEQEDVAAVVLAAGESRRFGAPKQLARLEGRTLLEHVLERARAAGLRPVVAVVPVWLTRPAAMDDTAELVWVRNPDPQRGMSHSLRLGFAALPDTVSAAVIMLGDQPRIPAEHLHALLAARGGRPMVATSHAGALMPPVLVERTHFGAVERAEADAGLRSVLARHPEWVQALKIEDLLPDVDSPADLERLAAADEPRRGSDDR